MNNGYLHAKTYLNFSNKINKINEINKINHNKIMTKNYQLFPFKILIKFLKVVH